MSQELKAFIEAAEAFFAALKAGDLTAALAAYAAAREAWEALGL